MPAAVIVSNIGAGVTEKDLAGLFNFCGRIESIALEADSGSPRSATVTFQHEAAAKSALILTGVTVGPSAISVTPASPDAKLPGGQPTTISSPDHEEYPSESAVPQEHKTFRRLAAEVISHGHDMTNEAILQAIRLDEQYGVSRGLSRYLKVLDSKLKAQERAQQIDTKYDVTGQLSAAWRTYVVPLATSASQTAVGVKVRTFYDDVVKTEVEDVLREANWLREQRHSQSCGCHAEGVSCTCAPGKCACAQCPKSTEKASCDKASCEKTGSGSCCQESSSKSSGEKAGSCCQPSSQKTGSCCKGPAQAKSAASGCGCNTSSTDCGCGGSATGSACTCPQNSCACSKTLAEGKDCGCKSLAEKCPCPPGECACAGCSKNHNDCGCNASSEQCQCPAGQCGCAGCPKKSATDCGCAQVASKCSCPEGKCVCTGCAKNTSQ